MADVTDATFEADVLQRSHEVPVVVDLWAPWCGPCRTLGPVLEEVVTATGGKVELAKVNVDENPQISQAFRVQGIPAVYALKDGKVVDGFVGAQPKPAVEKLVESLLPSEEEAEVDRLVGAGDEASLRRALDLDPDHAGAVVALAELLVGEGRGEEALALLARIPESAETRRVAALARLGSVDGDGDGAGPGADDGLAARLDGLLDRVKDDEDARREFLDVLELLGPEDPRTAGYRKALTARLF
ncbi:MAG: putative thioredoxin [Acidimicrobiales bacterium]|nr:putative thioredoxin [Acidimicrobiales bacterium]